MVDVERKIVLIFGRRGSGKSYLAREILKHYGRYVVYDTLHEYDRGVIFDSPYCLARFWRETYRGNFRLVYRPTDPEQEFEQIAAWVWLCGRLAFLVEEIDTFGSAHTIPPAFANIVQRGRHKEITLIGVTQRPYGIHRLLTSQAKQIYIFSTTEPRDREYLRNLLGSEIEPRLDALQQYECLRWDDGGALQLCKA